MPDTSVTRIAFISSSAGGIIDALADIADRDWQPFKIVGVLTDRPCGAERVAARHGVLSHRVSNPDNDRWSVAAADVLNRWSADLLVLLFLRRIGPAIWRDLNAAVWNLHQSILPAYNGLDALRRNHADALRAAHRGDNIALGVTLHIAVDELDTGPVIAQARFSVEEAPSLDRAAHLAFLHKLVLLLEALHTSCESTLMTTPQDALNCLIWRGAFRGLNPRTAVLESVIPFAQPWALSCLNNLAGANIS